MEKEKEQEEEAALKTSAGRVLPAIALLLCVPPVGVLFVSVATDATGMFPGAVGHALGARGLGRLAVSSRARRPRYWASSSGQARSPAPTTRCWTG